jgi:outer membrane protein insertion porin family
VGGYPTYGYGAPESIQAPPSPYGTYGYGTPQSEYGSAIAPGVTQMPNSFESTLAPGSAAGAYPGLDPNGYAMPNITAPGVVQYQPRQRIAPIDVWAQEARTGRIILGGSVNSDLGVAGQLVIDERNFDITRFPTSWSDTWSGRAFRGGGQNFRAEFMPGNRVERYTVSWTERNLFGYLPYSLSVGGFYYTRQYRDWTEQRLGGRVALGYEITKDLSISSELRMEDVKIFDPRLAGVSELDDALGSNDIYTARLRLAHDTRDSPFMSTEGALLELIFDQVFGEYDYSRGNVNYSRYFMLRERPDGSGRHTLASTWKFGVTGSQTPIFENYFAGGYSTMRGFSFRGASPVVGDIQVGGEFMFLGSLEYVFPLTADEMLRGVAFVDYGTVESELDIDSENFRVAPGLGLRVTVPALGPAPLAFDFAYPLNHADTDDRQVFSFFMGFTR